MLTFVGLGLYDERSITRRGADALGNADAAFVEWYTSILGGADVADLADAHDVAIEKRDRAGVEQNPEPILFAAETGHAVFLTAGDTMISTTHVDLRLRAHDRGIETQVIHGTTAQTAASSLTGLQNYRFGKATTLPFPGTHGDADVPPSVVETIEENRGRGLHTVVYLDIHGAADRYMDGATAASLLSDALGPDRLGVVIGQAGSDDPTVAADRLTRVADREFGPPLHLMVIPGELHALERGALADLAGAPEEALPDE